jgi:hypothetical protein
VKLTVKIFQGSVYFAVSVALSAGAANGFAAASTATNAGKGVQITIEAAEPTPPSLAEKDSPRARHLFQVKDEKGLLLTCIAPEIETNSETDNFKNCSLAPGRTLDDVMHSFVRGIHEEQREQLKEHAQSGAESVGKSHPESAQK